MTDFANESIYSLIPKVEAPAERPPRHRSKYPGTAPPTASTFGRQPFGSIPLTNVAGEYELPDHTKLAATWGPKECQRVHPANFTRASRSTGSASSTGGKFERKIASRKPAVPKPSDAPQVAPKTQKNFVLENAVQTITMRAEGKGNGSTVYDFLKKEDYGVVPSYLKDIQADIAAEKEKLARIMNAEKEEEAKRQSQVRVIAETEKQELLAALKTKWEAINREYQGMTHMTALDTFTKIRRKEQFESQLAELEKSIEKLSKKVVFVKDD